MGKTIFSCNAYRGVVVQELDISDPNIQKATKLRIIEDNFGSMTTQNTYQYPLDQLQNGNMLISEIATVAEVEENWVFDGAVTSSNAWLSCSGSDDLIYHACNNVGGLHIGSDYCEWDWKDSSHSGLIKMQIFVPKCEVTLYQHASYGGYSHHYAEDTTMVAHNDQYSSLKITGDCCITLYQHSNYDGY